MKRKLLKMITGAAVFAFMMLVPATKNSASAQSDTPGVVIKAITCYYSKNDVCNSCAGSFFNNTPGRIGDCNE